MAGHSWTAQAAQLCGLAALLLGWRPDEFWRATPVELAIVLQAMAGAGGDTGGMDTGQLAGLMERYPDER